MDQLISPELWTVVTSLATAVTAVFVALTWWVYRQIRDIMAETNQISRSMVRQTRRNLEDQHVPLLELQALSHPRPTSTQWRVVNQGPGVALQMRLFEESDVSWRDHKVGGVTVQSGEQVERQVVHGREVKGRQTEWLKRVSVVAVYFDAFGNKWVSRFEKGRFIGAERVDDGQSEQGLAPK